ncbi:hypothetical protein [Salinarimonas soli]|uniref:Uncharacterized protein n=1 Tax=Salinarimonas soli TaxID=1638099 RepID=A0A5B2VQU2_9HYPH|nr:hypothetical protein [Salinarimonas soli]KAA2241154.1 hypothetical protein F0L46_04980 [Salinarimonas soli]
MADHHPASPMEALRRGALADLDNAADWLSTLRTIIEQKQGIADTSEVVWNGAQDALWSAYLKIASYRDIQDCDGSG